MEKTAAQTTINLLTEDLKKTDQGNRFAGLEKLSMADATVTSTSSSLADLLSRNNMIESERGNFLAKAPRTDLIRGIDPGRWKVLNDENKSTLTRKTVRSNEPLLKLGATFGPWRGEIKIPQGNIGHIMRAQAFQLVVGRLKRLVGHHQHVDALLA